MAPGQWPSWYGVLWAVALGALVAARPHRHWLLAAASVAALGATTVVWGSTSRGRVELAERDVRGLSSPDAYAGILAYRLAADLQGDSLPRTPQSLLPPTGREVPRRSVAGRKRGAQVVWGESQERVAPLFRCEPVS
jgi:hypothetical protein